MGGEKYSGQRFEASRKWRFLAEVYRYRFEEASDCSTESGNILNLGPLRYWKINQIISGTEAKSEFVGKSNALEQADSSETHRTDSDEFLYTEIEVTPKGDCPIAKIGSNIETIHQRFDKGYCLCDIVVESFDDCSECDEEITDNLNNISDTLDEDDTRIAQIKREVNTECVCQIVLNYSSIPQCVTIKDEKFVMGVNISDRAKLQALMKELQPVSRSVKIMSLSAPSCDQESIETTMIPYASDYLTEKQLIAVVKAVQEGYYQFPRETSLEELADSLGISKTAIRKRLRGAESKILERTIRDSLSDGLFE